MQQPSSRQSQCCKKMGEKMGPNTLAAFHAGADFMQAKLEAEDESSDDEALLAGAPMSPTARRAWRNYENNRKEETSPPAP